MQQEGVAAPAAAPASNENVAEAPKRLPTPPKSYRWVTLRSGEHVLEREFFTIPSIHRWSDFKGGDDHFFSYYRKQLEILKDCDLAMNAACNASKDEW